jgi:hypothetical protein
VGAFYPNKGLYQHLTPDLGHNLAPQKEDGKDEDDAQPFSTLEKAAQRTGTINCHLPSKWGEEGSCQWPLCQDGFGPAWSSHVTLLSTPAGVALEPELEAPRLAHPVLPLYPPGPLGQVAGEQKPSGPSPLLKSGETWAMVTNTCDHRDTG